MLTCAEDRRELGLAHERLDEARVLGEVWQQALERDDPLEALDAALERAVDGRHAAHAQPLVHEIRTELLLRGDVYAHGWRRNRRTEPTTTGRLLLRFFRRFHVEREGMDRPLELLGERGHDRAVPLDQGLDPRSAAETIVAFQ